MFDCPGPAVPWIVLQVIASQQPLAVLFKILA